MLRVSAAALIVLAGFAPGCSTSRRTDPARTATEQLLLSTAADRAAEALDLPGVGGKRVHLVEARLESYDKAYVLGVLEDRLLRLGAHVVKEADKADWLVEVRSGALSVDHDSFLVGLPQIDVPLPATGVVSLPEIALFKRDAQEGVAKLAWTARDKADGRLVGSSGPCHGTCYVTDWSILFVGFTTEDVLPDEDDVP